MTAPFVTCSSASPCGSPPDAGSLLQPRRFSFFPAWPGGCVVFQRFCFSSLRLPLVWWMFATPFFFERCPCVLTPISWFFLDGLPFARMFPFRHSRARISCECLGVFAPLHASFVVVVRMPLFTTVSRSASRRCSARLCSTWLALPSLRFGCPFLVFPHRLVACGLLGPSGLLPVSGPLP